MAKKVIQMYDKYKSTTKIYPKVIKDCLQEDVTEYIEGQVEANPTLAGTEANLTGIQVGDTKYAVPQGTEVVANPELAGTEADLTGIQVGNTKYKAGGKQLYQHNISEDNFYGTSCRYSFSLVIINDSPTAFTHENLKKYIEGKTIPCNGWFTQRSGGTTQGLIVTLSATSNNPYISANLVKYESNAFTVGTSSVSMNEGGTFNDTVVAL